MRLFAGSLGSILGLSGLAFVALNLAACRTTPTEPPAPVEAVLPPTQFEPLTYVAPVEGGEGPAAQLYAPSSFAVWVGPEVADLKRQRDLAKGAQIEPYIDAAAATIPVDYIVIEAHVKSAFPDSSLAYDAVTFRNVEAYLEVTEANGDVRKVRPVQVLVDPEVDEANQGTLKVFGRTNLLIFPRQDVLTGRLVAPLGTPGVRLVLDGAGSTFAFSFPAAPTGQTGTWSPAAEEALRVIEVGYRDLYGRLVKLAHLFD